MASITLKGKAIHTIGFLPAIGQKAPDFRLTAEDLSDKTLKDYSSIYKILNIVPSLDTGVCAASHRRFNQEASALKETVILTVSRDLPFAQKRFCDLEGIDKAVALSSLRSDDFGKKYGVLITDGPLEGLFSRAVVVLDKSDRVIYTEQVPEIAQEPDYHKALEAVKSGG
jgi:thiol peroxidase